MVKNSTSARSPLSPTLWPEDAFRWWASLGLGAAVAMLLVVPAVFVLALLIGFKLIPAQHLNAANPTLTWPLLVAQLASYLPAIALLVVVLPRIARRPLAALGFRAPRPSDLVWGLCGALVMIAVASGAGIMQDVVFHLKTDEVQVHLLSNARGSVIAGFAFLACIAAPFAEEFVFRGFLFNAILRYVPVAGAIVLSAIVFGFAHLQPGNAGAIAPLAAAGLVLAAVYYYSGSLVASMLAHGLFNLVTVVAVVAFHSKG